MTTAPTPTPRDPLRVRRPISTFLAPLVLVATALAAVAAGGAVSPRLEAGTTGDTSTSVRGRLRSVVVENHGPLPVEITAATWATVGLADVELLVRTDPSGDDAMAVEPLLAGAEPFAPLTVPGWGRVAIVLRGDLACVPGRTWARTGTGGLALEIRTWSGVERTVDLLRPTDSDGVPLDEVPTAVESCG